MLWVRDHMLFLIHLAACGLFSQSVCIVCLLMVSIHIFFYVHIRTQFTWCTIVQCNNIFVYSILTLFEQFHTQQNNPWMRICYNYNHKSLWAIRISSKWQNRHEKQVCDQDKGSKRFSQCATWQINLWRKQFTNCPL